MYTIRRVALEPAAISASVLLSITFSLQEPQSTAPLQKRIKKPAYVQLSFHEASEKIIKPCIVSMCDGLSLGLHVGASGILISFPPKVRACFRVA